MRLIGKHIDTNDHYHGVILDKVIVEKSYTVSDARYGHTQYTSVTAYLVECNNQIKIVLPRQIEKIY